MESNYKHVEQPIIEEKPSCSSKEEIDNLVLPDCWNEKQASMFAERYKWLGIKEVQTWIWTHVKILNEGILKKSSRAAEANTPTGTVNKKAGRRYVADE